jgi:KipI family sensor histidine kinase inhibitor
MDFTIEPLSEDALLLRFGDRIDIAINARVHAAAAALHAANLPGIIDIAAAYATLLLRFDPFRPDRDAATEQAHQRLSRAVIAVLESGEKPPAPDRQRSDVQQPDTRIETSHRLIEIPVCYDGEFGPDLAEVAAHARIAAHEVIARHVAATYAVAMLSFAPGFPYLLGLDPALHMPRRATPRTRVPAGSVAIGGAQTGIYPHELPGGWNLIGRTPRVLFEPGRDPPCLLAPGDRVRFRAITADVFNEMLHRPAPGRSKT